MLVVQAVQLGSNRFKFFFFFVFIVFLAVDFKTLQAARISALAVIERARKMLKIKMGKTEIKQKPPTPEILRLLYDSFFAS